jgi:hypothetical protein
MKALLISIVRCTRPSTWPYGELTSPSIAGEEKLCQANEILKHEIDLNDFRDFIDSNLE